MRDKAIIEGAAAPAPDFAMLKAALVAAQASTPTARASQAVRPIPSPHAALHALFAGNAPDAESAAALGNRFSRPRSEVDEQ